MSFGLSEESYIIGDRIGYIISDRMSYKIGASISLFGDRMSDRISGDGMSDRMSDGIGDKKFQYAFLHNKKI